MRRPDIPTHVVKIVHNAHQGLSKRNMASDLNSSQFCIEKVKRRSFNSKFCVLSIPILQVSGIGRYLLYRNSDTEFRYFCDIGNRNRRVRCLWFPGSGGEETLLQALGSILIHPSDEPWLSPLQASASVHKNAESEGPSMTSWSGDRSPDRSRDSDVIEGPEGEFPLLQTLGTIQDHFRYLCPIDLYWYRISVSPISDIFWISADTIRYRYFQISEGFVYTCHFFAGRIAIIFQHLQHEQRAAAALAPRRLWLHPILSQHSWKGHFHMLYSDLRQHPEKFFAYCRMSVAAFDLLLSKVCHCISPEQWHIVTLRFLTTGNSFSALHFEFLLGITTVSKIVAHTCLVLCDQLKEIVLAPPKQEDWLAIAADFEKKPHSFHTVLVRWMGIISGNYNFVMVSTGAYGSISDARIWSCSRIEYNLKNNKLNVPEPAALLDYTNHQFPYVLIANEDFGLSPNLLRPFPRRSLNSRKRIFNYILTRARRYVECAFGILLGKWRVLMSCLEVGPESAINIVKACVVIHNFVRRNKVNQDHLFSVETPSDNNINTLHQQVTPLQNPIPLGGIDATPLAKNKPQFWTQVTMRMAPAHQEDCRFLVLHNLHDAIVLGFPWLQDVFDEPKSSFLPPHRDYDCAIDLIPG
ncbi:unnamed protein product [Ranitomeya imitator]|uniref:DDE Tnp4 domain-containing protein n=1 Tax=Ranitomeya imitator TaxID=111125 RepID=A0ABN9KZP1_9NEOB|nr:unnamed protein product [Ranitomeya imitator]